MDDRNWQGWAALALAGLALIIALTGRSTPVVNVQVGNGPAVTQPAAPAPSFQPNGPQRPDRGPGYAQPGPWNNGPFGRHEGPRGPWVGQPGFGGWHDFGRHRGPFFGPFFFFRPLLPLAVLGLLVWGAVRFFASRRDTPSGS